MTFENACNCNVDYKILENAIIDECKRRNLIPKEHYKIYFYRGYAGISIKHDKVSVHRIIGKYMVGYDFGTEVCVHHIDGNKLNNSISNLQVMKSSLHIKEHCLVQFVSEAHLKGFGNRVSDLIRRNDVTADKVIKLRSEGFTIKEISSILNCGYNTVCRRLKEAIDWGEE